MSAIAIQSYALLDDDECEQRILAAKEKLGEKLVILGHHYQRDEVFAHADFSGDSLKLSRAAAESKAEYIVFCGVHFMAEVADILSRPDQVSIIPDLAAGCSMADMANLAKVEKAWRELSSVLEPDECVTPVTYINSAADLKAFCGSMVVLCVPLLMRVMYWNGHLNSVKRYCFSLISTWVVILGQPWAYLWMRWWCGIMSRIWGGLPRNRSKMRK